MPTWKPVKRHLLIRLLAGETECLEFTLTRVEFLTSVGDQIAEKKFVEASTSMIGAGEGGRTKVRALSSFLTRKQSRTRCGDGGAVTVAANGSWRTMEKEGEPMKKPLEFPEKD
ncbi:hypothetical protein NL676_039334 [Syzygium grande]|nr:hypothetical protein NL676_039334 [Syzygium grande]